MECPVCHLDNTPDSAFCSRCGSRIQEISSFLQISTTLALPLEFLQIQKDEIISGKYRIIDRVGTGGMGVVFKAEDIFLKRHVALKFLRPEYLVIPEAKRRFLVEAQSAASIDHSNICTVYEISEYKGQTFIVMPFIDGESLRDRIARAPLSEPEAIEIASQIASGLYEAHQKGIIHRDIKSANIMISRSGLAKITDFGLAKLMEGTDLTTSVKIIGTLSYMSPEQARGDSIDHRTDIWSMGVLLYEILTGRFPFEAKLSQAILFSVCHEAPCPIRKIMKDISGGLEKIINKCLQKDPQERYGTAAELVEDLKKLGRGVPAQKIRRFPLSRTKILQTKKRKAQMIGGSVAVMFMAASLYLGWPKKIFRGTKGSSVDSYATDQTLSPIKAVLPGGPAVFLVKAALTEQGKYEIQGGSDRGLVKGICGQIYSPSDKSDESSRRPKSECVLVDVASDSARIEILDEKAKISAGDIVEFYNEPRGLLNIQTEPKGAELFLDDILVGRSELRIVLSPKLYRLQARSPGYNDFNIDINIQDREIFSRKLVLQAKVDVPRQQGLISINSLPQGASVFVGKEKMPQGQTPLSIPMNPGRYTLRLVLSGYSEKTISAEVREGKVVPLMAELKPLEGILEISSTPSGASVWIDGNMIEGERTPMIRKLPVASYLLVVKKDGHEDYSTRVDIRFDISKKIETILRPISKTAYLLMVDTNPQGALFYINNELKGITPKEVELNQPQVRVRLEKEGYKPISETLSLTSLSTHREYSLSQLGMGKLVISASHASKYRIDDGKIQGDFPPRREYDILEGKHEVEFIFEDGAKLTKSIEIERQKDHAIHGNRADAQLDEVDKGTYEIRGGPDVLVSLESFGTKKIPPQQVLRMKEGPKTLQFSFRPQSGQSLRLTLQDYLSRQKKRIVNLTHSTQKMNKQEEARWFSQLKEAGERDVFIMRSSAPLRLESDGLKIGDAAAGRDLHWFEKPSEWRAYSLFIRMPESRYKTEILILRNQTRDMIRIILTIDY